MSSNTTQEAWHYYIDGLKAYLLDDDTDKGLKNLNNSCAMDFLPAFKELSDIYLIRGDTEKAIQNILHAADECYIPAVHQLGYYHYTRSVGKMFQQKVMKQAAGFFFKGASLGFPVSLWTIGELNFKGYGNVVAADHYVALEYLQAAVEAGEEKAVDMRNKARIATGSRKDYVLKTHSYTLSSEKALYDITAYVTENISGKGMKFYPSSEEYKILYELYEYLEKRVVSMIKGEIGYDLRREYYASQSIKLLNKISTQS